MVPFIFFGFVSDTSRLQVAQTWSLVAIMTLLFSLTTLLSQATNYAFQSLKCILAHCSSPFLPSSGGLSLLC